MSGDTQGSNAALVQSTGVAQESVSGIREVQAFALEHPSAEIFNSHVRVAEKAERGGVGV